MPDTLEIIPADDMVDHTLFTNGNEIAINEFLAAADAPLEAARSGDFDYGFHVIRNMASTGRAMGWTLARLIHGMYVEWVAQGREVERFWLRNQDETTLKRVTMERYIDAWNAHLGVPEKYSQVMLCQPLKNAIQLGSAMAQGYVPSDEDMKNLSTATSFSEFSNVLRGNVGRTPRSNALTITLDGDTGDLYAYMAGEKISIGYLNIQDLEHNPITTKAIERIIRSSGIIRG